MMGTYSDGSRVVIVGERGGFVYVTFMNGPNKGVTCKVPPAWVQRDTKE